MHTVVLISDRAPIDDTLQIALMDLFPGCRIEVLVITEIDPENPSPATGSA